MPVNPFRWMLKQYERLGDLAAASLIMYCVAVLLAGVLMDSYENLVSVIVLALVGFVLSIPGSLAICIWLRFMEERWEAFFNS